MSENVGFRHIRHIWIGRPVTWQGQPLQVALVPDDDPPLSHLPEGLYLRIHQIGESDTAEQDLFHMDSVRVGETGGRLFDLPLLEPGAFELVVVDPALEPEWSSTILPEYVLVLREEEYADYLKREAASERFAASALIGATALRAIAESYLGLLLPSLAIEDMRIDVDEGALLGEDVYRWALWCILEDLQFCEAFVPSRASLQILCASNAGQSEEERLFRQKDKFDLVVMVCLEETMPKAAIDFLEHTSFGLAAKLKADPELICTPNINFTNAPSIISVRLTLSAPANYFVELVITAANVDSPEEVVRELADKLNRPPALTVEQRGGRMIITTSTRTIEEYKMELDQAIRQWISDHRGGEFSFGYEGDTLYYRSAEEWVGRRPWILRSD